MTRSRANRTGLGEPSPALIRAVTRLAHPLVRLLIARGVTLPYLTNLLKSVYVAVAEESFTGDGGSASVSRLSVITGLQRKDIKRIQGEPPPDTLPPSSVSLGARLIGIWTGDARFRARKGGGPAALARSSDNPKRPSFDALVRTVSTDVRPRVVLDEWLRLGLVHIDDEGLIRLNSDAFVPQQGFDEKVYYLGRNVADHIATSTHNLLNEGAPMLERAVYYDRLTPSTIAYLRKRAHELGMKALLALNKEALKRANADAGKDSANHRMALGLYYFDEPEMKATGGPKREPR